MKKANPYRQKRGHWRWSADCRETTILQFSMEARGKMPVRKRPSRCLKIDKDKGQWNKMDEVTRMKNVLPARFLHLRQ